MSSENIIFGWLQYTTSMNQLSFRQRRTRVDTWTLFSRYQHLKSLSTPSLITSGLLVFLVNRSFFFVSRRFRQCRIWGCSSPEYKEFFLVMTPCSLEEVNALTFSETCCLPTSERVHTLKNETAHSYTSFVALCQITWHHIPQKIMLRDICLQTLESVSIPGSRHEGLCVGGGYSLCSFTSAG